MLQTFIKRVQVSRLTQVHVARFGCGSNKAPEPDTEKKTFKVEEAKLGDNVHPTQFNVKDVLSNIDPTTNLKKEQSLEYKEVPEDGKHDPRTYHVMKSLKPFKNTDNDISTEYGLKVKGLEPTRFGDWERKGRCTDF